MEIFRLASSEVLRLCHVRLKHFSESETAHVYRCDFVLFHESRSDVRFSFCYREDDGSGTLFLAEEELWTRTSFRDVHLAIRYACSYAVNNHFRFSSQELSCRRDWPLLESYTEHGIPAFFADPHIWIEANPFVGRLLRKRLYRRILDFVTNERGLFVKKWSLETQKNYFHTSVNGGLPAVKKSDEIHEGTFMIHDVFHFLFLDPLLT
jgi:hypothetical protein